MKDNFCDKINSRGLAGYHYLETVYMHLAVLKVHISELITHKTTV